MGKRCDCIFPDPSRFRDFHPGIGVRLLIRINPQHALAFFHRALALTALSRDLGAYQDVLQVERLDSPDVDAAVLRELIEAVKSRR